MNIYIEKNNNPIISMIEHSISLNKQYLLTKNIESADVILSFAYSEKELTKMDKMKGEFESTPTKKIIFFSWFHAWNNFSAFQEIFSPERESCVLMNAHKYRIVQLPVSKNELMDEILHLLNSKLN